MSTQETVKPCPFCGSLAILQCHYFMYCDRCGGNGPDADSIRRSEVLAAWNRRAPIKQEGEPA